MLRELLLIQENQIIHGTHFLHSGEKRIYVVVSTEEREIFEFISVHPEIENKLRPNDIQTLTQIDQYTGHLVTTELIFVCEEFFLAVLICVAPSYEVVRNDEVDNAAILSHPNLMMITQDYIPCFVGVDCFDNHIGRGGQGGCCVAHKPSRECFLKGGSVVGCSLDPRGHPTKFLPCEYFLGIRRLHQFLMWKHSLCGQAQTD